MKISRQHIKIKKSLYAMVVLAMLTPSIYQFLGFKEFLPLKGAYLTETKPNINMKDWFSGDYQNTETNYLNENFGFRNIMVRLYNQYYFSAYRQVRAQNVILGKENYLYEENYIKAEYGIDYLGKDSIAEKVRKLRVISDSLKHYGIDLMVVLAPGKGSFYPEFIPDNYQRKDNPTNYEIYSEELKTQGVNLLDLNNWFRENKTKSKYPLYPKTGVHWSAYGELLAVDTIIGFMESMKNIQMPHLNFDEIEVSSKTQFTDDDAEKSLNLLFNIRDLEMAYPKYSIATESNTIKPKVVTIADSYYWGMYGRGISSQVFDYNEFWYYFYEIYSPESSEPKLEYEIDVLESLKKFDVVMLISTDANLHKFAFGFIDETYNLLVNKEKIKREKSVREDRIQEFIVAIKSSPDWLKAIEAKAKEQNISVEDAIRNDAEYMVAQEKTK